MNTGIAPEGSFVRQTNGFATQGLWFGPGTRPLAGWWTTPEKPSQDGVVIAAPLGYEARESRHGYLTLEEVPGIDHPMFRMWRRPAIVEQMLRFLASLPSAQTTRYFDGNPENDARQPACA